jgi:hypothetical protein
MPSTGRVISPIAVVAVSVSLIACGSARAPMVASVAGRAISQASLAHWMEIERLQSQGASTQIPVPDPPSYARCAAAAGADQLRLKRRRLLSANELRKRCATVYAQLRDRALAFLITADWLEGEAARWGVVVSQGEVESTYRELVSGLGGPSFASNMRRRGFSSADELLQLRLERLAEKLRAKIAAGSERRVQAFLAAYRQRWRQRTTCPSGYVIPECRNGPPLPASPAG